MDVKQYFRKIREIEATLTEDYPLVVSLETSDGGKAGLFSEVTRYNAARLIVESRAVLATAEQKGEFDRQRESSKKAADAQELMRRMQFTLLDEAKAAKSRYNGPSGSGK